MQTLFTFLTILIIHQYITSLLLQGLRYGGAFRILSDLRKTVGELPKSLTSLWLLKFFGVKVGLKLDWLTHFH